MPDYLNLQESLLKANASMEASESHGALCGMLCAQGSADINQWQQHVLGEQEEGTLLMGPLADELQQMYLTTITALNNEVTDFQCLLASDDEKLADRVYALANWCQGFLYGLAAGGIKQGDKMPEDSTELMLDLIQISQAVFDDEDSENSEDDYMQLEEFVRVGVLLMNEELQPVKQKKPIRTDTLH
ncbi:MAG: UPF0149 family protein [Gammaproteobacteria bacterium]|nr:UPF0149 family protein [Gammaproteobacteria bacterium]